MLQHQNGGGAPLTLLNTKRASDYLGISRAAISEAVARGRLQPKIRGRGAGQQNAYAIQDLNDYRDTRWHRTRKQVIPQQATNPLPELAAYVATNGAWKLARELADAGFKDAAAWLIKNKA